MVELVEVKENIFYFILFVVKCKIDMAIQTDNRKQWKPENSEIGNRLLESSYDFENPMSIRHSDCEV